MGYPACETTPGSALRAWFATRWMVLLGIAISKRINPFHNQLRKQGFPLFARWLEQYA